ncbi:Glucan endo-1,3-beta-glucosidase 10 [Linum perenne]
MKPNNNQSVSAKHNALKELLLSPSSWSNLERVAETMMEIEGLDKILFQFLKSPISSTMVIFETGWSSKGDGSKIGASLINFATYNGNITCQILTGGVTPLRPKADLKVYLFALFNEELRSGGNRRCRKGEEITAAEIGDLRRRRW